MEPPAADFGDDCSSKSDPSPSSSAVPRSRHGTLSPATGCSMELLSNPAGQHLQSITQSTYPSTDRMPTYPGTHRPVKNQSLSQTSPSKSAKEMSETRQHTEERIRSFQEGIPNPRFQGSGGNVTARNRLVTSTSIGGSQTILASMGEEQMLREYPTQGRDVQSRIHWDSAMCQKREEGLATRILATRTQLDAPFKGGEMMQREDIRTKRDMQDRIQRASPMAQNTEDGPAAAQGNEASVSERDFEFEEEDGYDR